MGGDYFWPSTLGIDHLCVSEELGHNADGHCCDSGDGASDDPGDEISGDEFQSHDTGRNCRSNRAGN